MEFLSRIWLFLKSLVVPNESVVDSFILRHKLSLFLFILALVSATLGYIGILGFIISIAGMAIFTLLGYLQFKRE